MVFCFCALALLNVASASSILSLKEIRESGVVVQKWDTSCGAAAMATVFTYHFNDPASEREVAQGLLRQTEPLKVRHRGGFSMLDMKSYAEERGYKAIGFKGLSFEDLRYFEAPNALVFANTRAMVNRLTTRLSNRGFSVVALSGELSQTERTHALQAMRDGRARVCVATDVAARGLDLPNLDLVVHAELPTNHETLLHRSGRTGRAGRSGPGLLRVLVIDRPVPSLLLGSI